MTEIDYQAKYEALLDKYEDLLARYAEALRQQTPPPIVYATPLASYPPSWRPSFAGSRTDDPLPEPARVWARVGDAPSAVLAASFAAALGDGKR